MTYFLIAALIFLLGAVAWVFKARVSARRAESELVTAARERARQRRVATMQCDHRCDMLFSSERPFIMDTVETGIVVRVLDGFDAEVEQ